MGQIADSLRATLRDLAQSDARLYRGLQEELADTAPSSSQPPPLLGSEARASREDLDALSIKVLWELCKQRSITGLSRGPRPRLVEALLSHSDGPPLLSALPGQSSKSQKGVGKLASVASGKQATIQTLENRLDRLERLVVLIAKQVGVPQKAIDQLLPPAALPPP